MLYTVKENDLTSIADAIRTKGGTSAALPFPNGFVTAVQNIQTASPTLTQKIITANGVYNAVDDNVDGYSSVSVSVPVVPFVSGTFTGQESQKGTAIQISIPYTGSGYPIAIMVYPSDGAGNPDSEFSSLVQKYAIGFWCATKSIPDVSPIYSSYNVSENKGVVLAFYKISDSDAASYSSSYGNNGQLYGMGTAEAGRGTPVRFSNANTMTVFIADTSYGFKDEIEYTYHIIYSE